MITLTNNESKTVHIALAKEVEVNGIKTATLEFQKHGSLSVPDKVMDEKMIKVKLDNGILKSSKKQASKPPQNTNSSGGSSSGSSKSGDNKGKEKTDGEKK